MLTNGSVGKLSNGINLRVDLHKVNFSMSNKLVES